jgi:3-oxoacyl-[acyl-carrier-protein] synthase II/nodulation protein E
VKRVVVTGLGCVTPIGNTVEAFRESLYAGRTGIAPFDLSVIPGALSPDPGIRYKTTAKVRDFHPTKNPEQLLSSGFILTSELGAQFGIIAARQAVAHSGLLQHHDPAAIAIVTGCSCGGRGADEDANRNLYLRNARIPPTAIIRTMASSGTSNIAIETGITGPTLNIATACARAWPRPPSPAATRPRSPMAFCARGIRCAWSRPPPAGPSPPTATA